MPPKKKATATTGNIKDRSDWHEVVASPKALRDHYFAKHSKKRAAELFARYNALVERDGPTCDLCGTGRPIEFDHIIPKPLGGTDHLDNLCLAHEYCNKQKGTTEHSVARRGLTAERTQREEAGRPWPPPRWEADLRRRQGRCHTYEVS